LPSSGRRFTTERKVRLSDASPGGRLRLDAVARYLHDVANDDASDVDLPDAMFWIVRRTKMRVTAPASIHEKLLVTTWCSGYGGGWAERRTQIVGDRGALIDAVSIWVSVDGETGAPKRLDHRFFDTWGEAAGDRKVRARLVHPEPPTTLGRSWPVRYCDLDVVGHVNNAIYWAALEEAMAQERTGGLVTAEIEFADGIGPRSDVVLVDATDADDVTHRLWFLVKNKPVASALFITQPRF
jgi:acyl-ACP thioesterase